VSSCITRGAPRAIKGSSPVQIEPESLRRVGHALDEMHERGQDHDWLETLLEYLHDLQTRRSLALKEGLQQLERGELEPARWPS
jgi:hypothetical protein